MDAKWIMLEFDGELKEEDVRVKFKELEREDGEIRGLATFSEV